MTLHPQSQTFLDAIADQDGPGWHELPPDEGRKGFKGLQELFGTGPDLARVENHSLDNGVAIRLYSRTPKSDSKLPVVMYFHGGGWVLGDLETHDTLCRHIAGETGFVVVSVDYGLAPENKFPGPVNDCYSATEFVYSRADELGVDADKLAVAGDSAGGNLAAAVAIRSRDQGGPPVKFQLLIYPVVEPVFENGSYKLFGENHGLSSAEMKWFWDQYLETPGDAENPLASLSKSKSLAGVAPAHLITAQYDVLRDEGERYAARLSADGVPTTTKRYDGMLHGFVHLRTVFDDADQAIKDISSELKKHLS